MIKAVIFDCYGVLAGELPNEQLLDYVVELRDQGLKTAILSNANRGNIEHIFTPSQSSLFNEIVLSADVHMIKPDPRIYELVAERLGIEPEACVFTDDNPHNADAALTVGMHGIVYHDVTDFREKLTSLLANNE